MKTFLKLILLHCKSISSIDEFEKEQENVYESIKSNWLTISLFLLTTILLTLYSDNLLFNRFFVSLISEWTFSIPWYKHYQHNHGRHEMSNNFLYCPRQIVTCWSRWRWRQIWPVYDAINRYGSLILRPVKWLNIVIENFFSKE